MKILILAEHFDPLLGGATHLTKQIVAGIAEQEHEVTLIVPNSGKTTTDKDDTTYPYQLVKIGIEVDIRDRKGFVRGKRKEFALDVDQYIKNALLTEKPDVLVVMTGIYLLRHLDFPFYRQQGIKVIANHLNIPPQECALSWKGDELLSYLKDRIRVKGIEYINAKRIAYHDFDAFTVISEHTKNLLSKIIGHQDITVIPLGCEFTGYLPPERSNEPIEQYKILTAGGVNTSKNQHIIPEIAAKLTEDGVNFIWHVIGPDRNSRYTAYFQEQIRKWGMEERVIFIPGIPKAELMTYYEQADIYVQASLEEGFCLTALDAILYGLPLIGSVAGAIPEFIRDGKGLLVENKPQAFYKGIRRVMANLADFGIDASKVPGIAQKYSWQANAKAYIQVFEQLTQADAQPETLETTG